MYSKAEQLKNNKVKKGGMFGKKKYAWNNSGKKSKGLSKISEKKKASSEDIEYLNYMKSLDLPCAICGGIGEELHHLRLDDSDRLHTSSGKRDHKLILPVCREHHTGKEASFHGNKYGLAKLVTKEFLLAIANGYYERYKERI